MNRQTLAIILIGKIADSENRLERLRMSLQAIDLLVNEKKEQWLRNYYKGL